MVQVAAMPFPYPHVVRVVRVVHVMVIDIVKFACMKLKLSGTKNHALSTSLQPSNDFPLWKSLVLKSLAGDLTQSHIAACHLIAVSH
jgi:hypothetical protein